MEANKWTLMFVDVFSFFLSFVSAKEFREINVFYDRCEIQDIIEEERQIRKLPLEIQVAIEEDVSFFRIY